MSEIKDVLDKMSLARERDQWRSEFRHGTRQRPYLMTMYEENRSNDLWRSTRTVEELCEYVLHLEQMLGKSALKKDT